MKKFFTLMVLTLVAISANAWDSVMDASTWNAWNAETTTIDYDGEYVNMAFTNAWDGCGFWVARNDEESGDTICADWSDYEILVYEVDNVNGSFNICVEYLKDCSKSSSGAIGPNGYGYVRLDDNYSDMVAQTWIQATAPGSVTIKNLLLMDAEQFEEYKESKKPQGEKINLWTGEMKYDGTWPSIPLAASCFEDAEAGDMIEVQVSSVDPSIEPTWEWGSQLFFKSGDWTDLEPAWKVESIAEAGPQVFVFNDYYSGIAKTNGLVLQGMCAIVTGIDFRKAGPAGTTVWEGEQAFLTDWGQFVQVPAQAFEDANVGDIIVATVSAVNPEGLEWGSQLLWKNGSTWAELPGTGGVSLPEPADYTLLVTESILPELKESGLIIQGVGFTLSKLALQTGSNAVGGVRIAPQADGKTYNLAGQAVDGSYKGIVIMNGKKYLK